MNTDSAIVNTHSGKTGKSVHVQRGIGVHVRALRVFTFTRNERSRCCGICIVIINNYEHDSHNQSQYIDSGDYRSLVAKISSICNYNQDKTQDQIEKCKSAKEEIGGMAAMADLAAQQTMATATRGLLVSSYFQYVVSVITLILIGMTLWATWEVLNQANETTRLAGESLEQAMEVTLHAEDSAKSAKESVEAAWDTLEETKKTSAQSLKPYLTFETATSRWGSPFFNGYESATIFIRVKNIGKSMARNISFLTVEGVTMQVNFKIISGADDSEILETDMAKLLSHQSAEKQRHVLSRTSLSPGDSFWFRVHCPFKNKSSASRIPKKNTRDFYIKGDFSFFDDYSKTERKCSINAVCGDGMAADLGAGTSLLAGENPDGQIVEND